MKSWASHTFLGVNFFIFLMVLGITCITYVCKPATGILVKSALTSLTSLLFLKNTKGLHLFPLPGVLFPRSPYVRCLSSFKVGIIIQHDCAPAPWEAGKAGSRCLYLGDWSPSLQDKKDAGFSRVDKTLRNFHYRFQEIAKSSDNYHLTGWVNSKISKK